MEANRRHMTDGCVLSHLLIGKLAISPIFQQKVEVFPQGIKKKGNGRKPRGKKRLLDNF